MLNKNNLKQIVMKAKTVFLGLVIFVSGVAFSVGVHSSNRHHNFQHEVVARKSAIIEVGAPLTYAQLKIQGFI
jgi:uncharacterized membrane protein YoaK (UPF0700 family)